MKTFYLQIQEDQRQFLQRFAWSKALSGREASLPDEASRRNVELVFGLPVFVNKKSKVTISNLEGLFSKSLKVKVRGQNSNRNTVKQTAENCQKVSGDEDAAGIMSLVSGVKKPRLGNGLEVDMA